MEHRSSLREELGTRMIKARDRDQEELKALRELLKEVARQTDLWRDGKHPTETLNQIDEVVDSVIRLMMELR